MFINFSDRLISRDIHKWSNICSTPIPPNMHFPRSYREAKMLLKCYGANSSSDVTLLEFLVY